MYNIFFYIFSIINLLALKNIYWPVLKKHIDGLNALQSVLQNWQLVFGTYIAFIIVLIRQWWLKTAQPIDENKYLISHILNGKMVKFIVKPMTKKIKAVVDENYEECYFDEAKPYFSYEIENFYPELIGLNKPLFIHFDEFDVIQVFPNKENKSE